MTPEERSALLTIARKALENPSRRSKSAEALRAEGIRVTPEMEKVPRGVFVTLRAASGDLRGCIGTTAASSPLYRAIAEYTVSAAQRDPRFPPVRPDEVPSLDLHLSILFPDRTIGSPAELRLGVDGVTLHHPDGVALFLPEVATETGWDVETLLEQLSRKAGLPARAWRDPAAVLTAFETESFGEHE